MIALAFIPTALPALLLAVIVAVPVGARWLRVAQREHYVPGSVSTMAWLWVRRAPFTGPLAIVAVGAAVAAALSPYSWLQFAALVALVLTALLPWGLGVRGTSKKLAFTGRLTRLAVLWAMLHLALGILTLFVIGPAGPALVLLLSAPLTDLALAIMAPIEKAASQRFVVQAQKRLKQSGARVVAITGSYGKTSTKNYVAHLLSAAFTTVASPASFNNRLGLSRAVNDKLVPGTEIFVAEMGMAAPGQIAELCRQFPPAIAAITVVGEAHLQRMRTPEAIFAEKASITDFAPTVVIPIDDPRLAALAEQCRAAVRSWWSRPAWSSWVAYSPSATGRSAPRSERRTVCSSRWPAPTAMRCSRAMRAPRRARHRERSPWLRASRRCAARSRPPVTGALSSTRTICPTTTPDRPPRPSIL